MRETLEMMKGILTGKESKVDEQKLISEYKKDLLPNILAYFYVNNYGIINNTSNLYPFLLDEDKASFCLQELDNCLQNYDENKQVKFITYFVKCYKNRLRVETEAIMTQKRKSIYSAVDVDNYEELLINDFGVADVDMILNEYKLTDTDKKQCKLLNAGYSFKEIATMFKQATITIYKRNQKIKEKITNYNINFS